MLSKAHKPAGRLISFQKKNGNVLVLVVILFMMVSILALGILSMSHTESRIVHFDERHEKAYYVARSVVSATETWVSSHYNDRNAMKLVVPETTGKANAIITNSILDNNPYTLVVWRENHVGYSDIIYIEAQATYSNVTASAKMALEETISGRGLFDDAIYSYGPFSKTSGGAITLTPQYPIPSVSTGATISDFDKNVKEDDLNSKIYGNSGGEINFGVKYKFEPVDPPVNVIYAETIPGNQTWNNTNTVIDDHTHFLGNIAMMGGTLEINNGDSSNPKDIHIRIDGSLTFTRQNGNDPVIRPSSNFGGKIFIYIYGDINTPGTNDRVIIEGDKTTGIAGPTTGPSIFLICNKNISLLEENENAAVGGNVKLIGNPYVVAYVYAPTVVVEFGGTTDFYGAIISKAFGWNGSVGINYVKPYSFENSPFADMDQYNETIAISNRTWFVD